MSSEMDELVTGVAALNSEVIVFVRGCDDVLWDAITSEEGWPIRVVARHCAEGHGRMVTWLDAMASGQGVDTTADELDLINARDAEAWADSSREDVLQRLADVDALLATLHSLSDAALSRSAPFGPAGGAILPVRRLTGAAERHLRTHLESMRACVTTTPADNPLT